MEAEYLAIDGSVVAVEADARLGDRVTRTGWATVPALMQGHPFSAYPPGHSKVVEDAVRADFPDLDVRDEKELSLKGGTLRVARVETPKSGSRKSLTIGAWEGRGGCLTTSIVGGDVEKLVEIFDSLAFRDSRRGVVVDSPVLPQPRPPEVLQEVEGLGVLSIRPAVASELERVPRAEGQRTKHGEVFRVRSGSNALLFLGKAAVARVQPPPDAELDRVSEVVDGLRVSWRPRGDRRPER